MNDWKKKAGKHVRKKRTLFHEFIEISGNLQSACLQIEVNLLHYVCDFILGDERQRDVQT